MSRKYVRDYRLEEELDLRGRVKKTTVYIGGDYVFEDPVAAGRGNRLRVAILTAVCWPLFFVPLFPVSQAGKLIYAALPFACGIIPIVFLSMSAYTLLRSGEVLRHEQAARLSRRLPASAFFMTLFSGTAALAIAFTALLRWRGLPWADALFLFCAAAMCALGAVLLRHCRKFKVIKRESVNNIEPSKT